MWLLYLPVGDLGESLARAREEGGEVVRVRTTSSGELANAVPRDPLGACFALVPG
jgi:predicted enzyme related to lactoylglutathione lyase